MTKEAPNTNYQKCPNAFAASRRRAGFLKLCIGTMNPPPPLPGRGAGRLGPLLGGVRGGFVAVGSWKALFRVFSACIGTMNLERVRPATKVLPTSRRQSLSQIPSAGKMPAAPYGSWKAPTTFVPCIGTMNLTLRQNLFGVPPSGGPDRLKPGHQTAGSWRARFRIFSACIGTMNRRGSPSPVLGTPSPPLGERVGVGGGQGHG